jgi:hypothetical protein
MAQHKTVGFVGGSLILGALTFVSAVPAQAVDAEPSPAAAQTAATSSASAQAVDSESSPAAAQTAAASSASAQAKAKPAKPTKRSTPKKGSDIDITIGMVKSGKAELQRGDSGKAVSKVQQKLTEVGIITPVTGDFDKATALNVARFNEKFRNYAYKEYRVVTKKTWLKLHKESKTKIPKSCRTKPAALCASKRQKIVRYYKKGKLITALDARFGAPGFRTREGNFKIFNKIKNDFSTLYNTPMPWSMYFSGGMAFHHSVYFPKDGYEGGSHGCVNFRDKKEIIKLWKKVKIGTFTKVY